MSVNEIKLEMRVYKKKTYPEHQNGTHRKIFFVFKIIFINACCF